MSFIDNYLDKYQAWQIAVVGIYFTIAILAVFSSVILNGMTNTRTMLIENLIVVSFVMSIPLVLLPVYQKTDDRVKRMLKQGGYSLVLLMLSSGSIWIYSFYATSPTPLELIIFDMASWIWKLTGVTILLAILGVGNIARKK